MKQETDTVRRQLGELGAMAARTEEDERRILKRAQALLDEAESEIESLRHQNLTGNDESQARYTHLIEERGRLNQVIATARQALQTAE